MKIPLWGKTESGKLEPFPYHLLETLSDGSLGMIFTPVEADRHVKNVAFGKFRHCFEWNPINCPTTIMGNALYGCEYRLRHQ